jgi:hypothetical protein
MRLSRPRVVLRAVLLVTGGAYMLWRGLSLRGGGEGLDPAGALHRQRLALVWILVAVVAFATAAAALLALRPRRTREPLRIGRGDADGPGPPLPPGGDGPQ